MLRIVICRTLGQFKVDQPVIDPVAIDDPDQMRDQIIIIQSFA